VPEACAAAIKVTETLRPERKTAAVYDRLYPRYQSLYRSLRDEFCELGRF
jgi:sugar (pentulose or hexulose) kinase